MKNLRTYIDCRDFPDQFNCTLVISGKRNEVLKVAVRHVIEEHGHQDSADLKMLINKLIKKDTEKI